MQYVPILEVLKQYLGQEDVWASMNANFMEVSDPDILAGYKAGAHFQSSEFYSAHPHALRIVLYTDEFEIVNPLGAKRGQQKLLAVYYMVENIEAQYRSTLSNIHLALLVRNKIAQKYGYEGILKPLITDLKILEKDGIFINVNGTTHHRLGSVIAMCGDNLSAHAVGGFSSCFNSGRICRHCMALKPEICTKFEESQFVLRTTEVHAYHLNAIKADSHNCSVYGVYRPCVLDELRYFDVTKCLPPDPMHDLLEGVVHHVIRVVLKELLTQRCLNFSSSKLQKKMEEFKYGSNDAMSKPVVIQAKNVKHNEPNIVGSASQKLCLFRLLPFLIGEFVPEDADIWELYLSCREIVDICLSPIVKKSWLPYLQQEVIDLSELFAKYSQDQYPCKLHYLIHYHRHLSDFGPLRNFWCMRFESKHQYFKNLSSVVRNFRNVALTLTTRHQSLQCWQMNAGSFFQQQESALSNCRQISVLKLPRALQRVLTEMSLVHEGNLWKTNSVQVNSMTYQDDDVIIIDIKHEEIPVFGKVKHILQCDTHWYICIKEFDTCRFNRHLHAYEIGVTERWSVMKAGPRRDFQSLSLYEIDDKCMVSLKHRPLLL
nr:uncharacterized protein LOC129266356 [Lytechinus pictus]